MYLVSVHFQELMLILLLSSFVFSWRSISRVTLAIVLVSIVRIRRCFPLVSKINKEMIDYHMLWVRYFSQG